MANSLKNTTINGTLTVTGVSTFAGVTFTTLTASGACVFASWVGFGSNAVATTDKPIFVDHRPTLTAAATTYHSDFHTLVSPAGATSQGTVGLRSYIYMATAQITPGTLSALAAEVNSPTSASGGCSVLNAFRIELRNTGAGAANVTEVHGIDISSSGSSSTFPFWTGIKIGVSGATIGGTNKIALDIGNVSGASSGNWSIRTGTGLCAFGGTVTIASTLGVTGITTLAAALVGAASQDVFNTTSTTVNAFGAATTLTIGALSGTQLYRGLTTIQYQTNLTASSANVLDVKHTTSGTAGIGFGVTIRELLQNGSGITTQAYVEQSEWTTTALTGAEYVKHTFKLLKAGSLTTFVTMTTGSVADSMQFHIASSFDSDLTFGEGVDINTGDTTGSKIGLATTQKLGFWNATPIVQPASANQAALALDVDVTGADLVDKAAINTNFTAIQTLVNQLRSDLVSAGLIKGAA